MHDPRTSSSSNIDILRTVLLYGVFAGLWILVSDQLTEWMFGDTPLYVVASTIKGWLFVAVTCLLLYLLLKRLKERGREQFVPKRIPGIVDWKPWQLYLFAAVVTLITVLIRISVANSFGEHPMLILLMLPIILSAALGGIGPGLFSTLIAALSAAYFLPPDGSFRIEQPNDLLQLGFLLANGLIVSFLSTMLHAARHRSERERQKAELHLAEKTRALELLNAIAEGSTDVIFVKDVQGRYLLANKTAARITHRPVGEILGKDDTALFPPEQARNLMLMDQQVISSGHVSTFDYDVSTADGTRSFLTTKGPLRDVTGNITGVFGIARDISSIKATEVALRRERDRNQRYLDTVQTIMVALDNEGYITMITRYGCELLGYSEDELLGKNWFISCMSQPDGVEITLPVYHKILAGDLAPDKLHENEVLCRDGSRRTVSWRITQLRNEIGNIVGTLSSGEDITKRRKAEDLLRESEETYRSLFEHMLNGFAYCHMYYEDERPVDFVYLSVNKAFENQTGLKEVVGRKVSEVVPGIREADPELFEIYGRVALSGQSEHVEVFVQALDMWFSISVYSPKFEYFVAVFDVITERKNAEIALLKQTGELRQRNEELERFNRATVGREVDMIALKQQINELSRQLGKEPPYRLSFLDTPDGSAQES